MGDAPSIVQDAGDIVLLDNNFKSIVSAMKEGRVILANIRRMLIYLLSTNAGMVTDSLLVIPIGLEPPEREFLSQKPEDKDAPILSKILISRMVICAVTMAALALGTYYLALTRFSQGEANTLAFTALVVVQWANAFTVRGTYESAFKRLKVKNPLFVLALLVAITLQALVLFGPLSAFAKTVPVDPLALAVTVLAALAAPIIATEAHKKLAKK